MEVVLQPSLQISHLHERSLVALYKLCKASLLYPHCYALKDIVFGARKDCGAFSDVYIGHHGEQDLCLKVVRLSQKSDVEALLKVRWDLYFYCLQSILLLLPGLSQRGHSMGTT